jgi:hypothetical protein
VRETRFEAFLEDLDLGPDGRFGIFIVAALKASMCSRSSAIELKVASLRDFSARIEKPDFARSALVNMIEVADMPLMNSRDKREHARSNPSSLVRPS